jgi:CubicO group peptidase (beta-lactamase class C family)
MTDAGLLRLRLDECLTPFNRSDQPGLVVGVAHRGKTIYRRGFGLASIEQGVANQPSTRMRIGSTSKHFGALACLLLAEQGRLDIDGPIGRFIPELDAQLASITLRQLMTHTSGLRDFVDLSLLVDGMSVKPADYPLRAQLSQRTLNFEPGTKAIYNNGGYHLLSVAIARAAGMPFDEFVASRIFGPLGMWDTFWASSDMDVHCGMASLYVPRSGGGWRKGLIPNECVLAEGGMVSTVDDLLRWMKHLRSSVKLVGNTRTWQEMTRMTILANGTLIPYGLGLMLGSYRGLRTLHHPGSVVGGSCQMLTLPERELDIAIMTNGALVDPVGLADTLAGCVLHEEELPPAASCAQANRFQCIVGKTYRSTTSGFTVTFHENEGKMAAAVFNNAPIGMSEEGGNLCLPFEKIAAGPLLFRTLDVGVNAEAPAEIVMEDAGATEKLVRLTAEVAPIDASLVGRYEIPELNAVAQVRVGDARLELHIQGRFGQTMLELRPMGLDTFGSSCSQSDFPPRGTVEVVRDSGTVVALRVWTMRTRGLDLIKDSR